MDMKSIGDSVMNVVESVLEPVYDLVAGLARVVSWPFRNLGKLFRGTSVLGWRWYWFARTARNVFWLLVVIVLAVWAVVAYQKGQMPMNWGHWLGNAPK